MLLLPAKENTNNNEFTVQTHSGLRAISPLTVSVVQHESKQDPIRIYSHTSKATTAAPVSLLRVSAPTDEFRTSNRMMGCFLPFLWHHQKDQPDPSTSCLFFRGSEKQNAIMFWFLVTPSSFCRLGRGVRPFGTRCNGESCHGNRETRHEVGETRHELGKRINFMAGLTNLMAGPTKAMAGLIIAWWKHRCKDHSPSFGLGFAPDSRKDGVPP